MYEIPPSVDFYLQISSRSMIHFPTVSENATLTSSLEADDVPTTSPKNESRGFGSANLDMTSGNCLAPSPKRKRDSEEYDADQLLDLQHSRAKNLSSLNGLVDKHGNGAVNDSITLPNTEASRGVVIPGTTYRDEELGSNPPHRRLPKLKPKKDEAKDASLEVQKYCRYSTGRSATRINPWGPQSYSDLISGAIKATPAHRASLQQIYDWIVTNVPYFNDKANYPSTKGWKNAIRHTLSIRKRFNRIINERSPHASLWTFSKHGYRTMAKSY